jgi:hypothetical protein
MRLSTITGHAVDDRISHQPVARIRGNRLQRYA